MTGIDSTSHTTSMWHCTIVIQLDSTRVHTHKHFCKYAYECFLTGSKEYLRWAIPSNLWCRIQTRPNMQEKACCIYETACIIYSIPRAKYAYATSLSLAVAINQKILLHLFWVMDPEVKVSGYSSEHRHIHVRHAMFIHFHASKWPHDLQYSF